MGPLNVFLNKWQKGLWTLDCYTWREERKQVKEQFHYYISKKNKSIEISFLSLLFIIPIAACLLYAARPCLYSA
jgi:hypothetical protein